MSAVPRKIPSGTLQRKALLLVHEDEGSACKRLLYARSFVSVELCTVVFHARSEPHDFLGSHVLCFTRPSFETMTHSSTEWSQSQAGATGLLR